MTPTCAEALQIASPRILVVEGIDDKLLFESLLTDMDRHDIQVLPIGGKTQLSGNLRALVINEAFMTSVNTLVVARDADSDADCAFRSVCGCLANAGLTVPTKPMTLTGSRVRTGILIIPPDANRGKLEDVCLESVRDDVTTACVNAFFDCLGQLQSYTMPRDISKAKVHAFLSSRPEPDKRLGEAAQAGYWSLRSVAFDPIREFLSTL
jgi:hypothetical protein